MPEDALRALLLRASASPRARHLVETAPGTRSVVRRFVAGSTLEDAVAAASRLAAAGLGVSIDHLGEGATDLGQAMSARDAYLQLLARLGADGLSQGGRVEVSLKLSALGQGLGAAGPARSTELAHQVCQAAEAAGTTVTLDMEGHTTTDDTLATLRDLRADFPAVGAVLQASLHRTETDCRDLAYPGSRVRLCKGAYAHPVGVGYRDRADVDRAYVRCLKVLMAGQGRPMVATHDPRLLRVAAALAARSGRGPGTYEYQLLYGVRPDEQRRLAAAGELVRVYVPYGRQWYGYLMRRMAERPANTAFFLRSLVTRG